MTSEADKHRASRPSPGALGKEERTGRTSDELFKAAYEALHRIAERRMQGQEAGHTLQPSALVNEAYLRMKRSEWVDEAHFLATAARAMRSVLVDHARRRRLRGERTSLDAITAAYEERTADLLALDEALDRLAQVDEGLVRLVELRFFAGLGMKEASRVLDVPLRTLQRDWATARAWLRKAIR